MTARRGIPAARGIAAVLLAAVVGVAAPAPAVAGAPVGLAALGGTLLAQDGGGCAAGRGVYDGPPPWPQKLLAPDRVWPVTTGDGVRVAVIATGVDARHPQFGDGQIGTGATVSSAGSARRDCDGRGTFAAGVIAARPAADTTFSGIAPGAQIVPIRVTGAPEPAAGPDALADAIDAAVDADAEVICVVTPAAQGSPALTSAISRALAADAVVVAPVAAPDETGQVDGAQVPVSYPAADERVLAVAAVDATGAASTPAVDRVDVAAPGRALVGAAPGSGDRAGHLWPVDDDAMAAAYAAGVVALVRSYRPELSARQVVARVVRTADRATGQDRDAALGWGVVDLSAAVTAEGVDTGAARADASAAPAVKLAATDPDDRAGRVPAAMAVLGLALAALLVIGAAVVRRGRARGWRAD
nr:S8 family serine peptidase [Micromonospora sp. DSM 115978]